MTIFAARFSVLALALVGFTASTVSHSQTARAGMLAPTVASVPMCPYNGQGCDLR